MTFILFAAGLIIGWLKGRHDFKDISNNSGITASPKPCANCKGSTDGDETPYGAMCFDCCRRCWSGFSPRTAYILPRDTDAYIAAIAKAHKDAAKSKLHFGAKRSAIRHTLSKIAGRIYEKQN
jgi:hypothetical protein